jgi:23S rRNA pseudouridine1911/1915/1917 synthase
MIIYEDEYLMVVNKVSGKSTISEKSDQISLEEELSKITKVFAVNRLDKRVSGLVLFAKNKEVLAQMQSDFKERKVIKKYRCVIKSTARNTHRELMHFHKKAGNKALISATKKADYKPVHLKIRPIAQSDNYTCLEVELFTGRFHQIRATLAFEQMPIVGDLKYGYPRSTPDGSIFLQSYFLKFQHPVTKHNLTFELPFPENWGKYGVVKV